MNAMVERLKSYAKFKGISFSDMERSLGKSRGYLSVVKNMSTDVLEKACELYSDLSCEWIVRGEGSMLKQEHSPNDTSVRDKRNDLLLAKLEQAQKTILNLELELELRNA